MARRRMTTDSATHVPPHTHPRQLATWLIQGESVIQSSRRVAHGRRSGSATHHTSGRITQRRWAPSSRPQSSGTRRRASASLRHARSRRSRVQISKAAPPRTFETLHLIRTSSKARYCRIPRADDARGMPHCGLSQGSHARHRSWRRRNFVDTPHPPLQGISSSVVACVFGGLPSGVLIPATLPGKPGDLADRSVLAKEHTRRRTVFQSLRWVRAHPCVRSAAEGNGVVEPACSQ